MVAHLNYTDTAKFKSNILTSWLVRELTSPRRLTLSWFVGELSCCRLFDCDNRCFTCWFIITWITLIPNLTPTLTLTLALLLHSSVTIVLVQVTCWPCDKLTDTSASSEFMTVQIVVVMFVWHCICLHSYHCAQITDSHCQICMPYSKGFKCRKCCNSLHSVLINTSLLRGCILVTVYELVNQVLLWYGNLLMGRGGAL